jgi:nitrogen fixation/metabolism regulation signal transduction histidine kinase
MPRLSIARSLRLALVGLTIVLAALAALGISSLYNARQRYERTLSSSSALAVAAADLESAAVADQEVLRDARGPSAAQARIQARDAYAAAAATAASLARGDPTSRRLVADEIAAGPSFSTAGFADRVQARQRARQAQARSRAAGDSRRAILLVAIAGLLALVGALALVSAVIGGMRRPLVELVEATRRLAAGELVTRVRPSGPRELRDLGATFNAMAADLAGAQQRLETERRRLSVTIESLGDGLIVTEPGSRTIAAVNPRVTELVPELHVGDSISSDESPLPPLEVTLEGEQLIEHRGRTLAVTAARLGPESDGVVWTLRDMTERARLERAKSEFVATASHELRSPLTSIKGFVELLQSSPERMSARQREFVDIILKSTDRLTELVGDLLDVARIEADRVELNRRPVDVGEAVRETAELMGPRIAQKHQQLRRADAAARARGRGAGSPDRREPAHKRASVHGRRRQDRASRGARASLGPDHRA